jgi:hypothetical protein
MFIAVAIPPEDASSVGAECSCPQPGTSGQLADQGSGVIRIRSSSTTAKFPAQSWREARAATATLAIREGDDRTMRKSTMPQLAGSPDLKASSPKSLSKVRRTRASACAWASTSRSVIPGDSVLTHRTSWPACLSASTAAAGEVLVRENPHHSRL